MTDLTRRLVGVAAALGLLALAACDLSNLQAPGLAPDKEQAARKMFVAMQKGDLSGIPLGAEMNTPQAQAAIPQIFAAVPKGEPTKVRLLSWRTNWSALSGPRTEDMSTLHEYTFGTNVFTVETVMARDLPAKGQPGPWRLRGFHIKPVAAAAPGPAGKANAAPPGQTGTSATGASANPPPNDFVDQPTEVTGAAGRPARETSNNSLANSEARQDQIDEPIVLEKPKH